MSRVTELLRRWNRGEQEAAAEVLPLVYDELHRIACHLFLGERNDHTLQATAVVHEAYVQLIEQNGIQWQNRAQFLGFAAHLMRRVLVDYSRNRNTDKRGGRRRRTTLIEARQVVAQNPPEVLAVDEVLRRLATLDEQMAKIVELRFFGGLTIDESADYLGISAASVSRQWRRAKAWLYDALREEAETY